MSRVDTRRPSFPQLTRKDGGRSLPPFLSSISLLLFFILRARGQAQWLLFPWWKSPGQACEKEQTMTSDQIDASCTGCPWTSLRSRQQQISRRNAFDELLRCSYSNWIEVTYLLGISYELARLGLLGIISRRNFIYSSIENSKHRAARKDCASRKGHVGTIFMQHPVRSRERADWVSHGETTRSNLLPRFY
jgi:hypothetical protein